MTYLVSSSDLGDKLLIPYSYSSKEINVISMQYKCAMAQGYQICDRFELACEKAGGIELQENH